MASSQDLAELENALAWEDVPIRLAFRRHRDLSRANLSGDISSPSNTSQRPSSSDAQGASVEIQGLRLLHTTRANSRSIQGPVRATSESSTSRSAKNQKTNTQTDALPSSQLGYFQARQPSRGIRQNESLPRHKKPIYTNQSSQLPKPGRTRSHNLESSQATSHEKFPKLGLVTTAQLRAQQLEKERRAKYERFRKPPPAGETFKHCLFYAIEEDLGTPQEMFGDTLGGLDSIRDTYEIYIDSHISETGHCLRLQCDDQSSILPAWQAVERAIKDVLAEGMSQPTENFIEPALPRGMQLIIIPIIKKYSGENVQKEDASIIHKIEVKGANSTMEIFREWTHVERETDVYRTLAESLSKALSRLRYLRSGARMRLHFGWLEILRYKRDFLYKEYDLDAFQEMMKSSRTQATLARSLGDACTAWKILSYITDPKSNDFIPKDSRLDDVSQVKPKFTLIILTSSGAESIRIEADIDTTDGAESYQIGETRVYRHGTKKTRLTVNVMDLKSHVDCSLEVITHEEINNAPSVLYTLVEGTVSQGILEKQDRNGDRYPFVVPKVPIGVHIQQVIIRSNWQYRLAAAGRYIFEVAVYRTWDGHDTSSEPTTTCAAQLYNKEWDQMLGPVSVVGEIKDWRDELEVLLPRTDTSSGITAFLNEAAHIQTLLGVKIGISRELAT